MRPASPAAIAKMLCDHERMVRVIVVVEHGVRQPRHACLVKIEPDWTLVQLGPVRQPVEPAALRDDLVDGAAEDEGPRAPPARRGRSPARLRLPGDWREPTLPRCTSRSRAPGYADGPGGRGMAASASD